MIDDNYSIDNSFSDSFQAKFNVVNSELTVRRKRILRKWFIINTIATILCIFFLMITWNPSSPDENLMKSFILIFFVSIYGLLISYSLRIPLYGFVKLNSSEIIIDTKKESKIFFLNRICNLSFFIDKNADDENQYFMHFSEGNHIYHFELDIITLEEISCFQNIISRMHNKNHIIEKNGPTTQGKM